ncbi:MAG TPA: hypothetical protein VFG87_20935 [Amycolatopsis sp.]|nr:hypothetical protein [Amycolatopsis sp.]
MTTAKLWTPTVRGETDTSFGLRLGFELDSPPRSWPAAAFLLMRFDDARVDAVELRVETPETASTEVSVLSPGLFGWTIGDPEGRTPIPRVGEVYASLSGPVAPDGFTGSIRLDTTMIRSGPLGGRRDHRRAAGPVRFALRPPEGWTGTVAPAAAGEGATGPGAVRLCIAADMQRYSRFRTPEAARAQQRFVAVLARARRYAGIGDGGVDLQQSGDGEFAVLPAGVDESVVIPRFVAGLRGALEETNSDLSERARVRIRIALHRGHVAPGPNGWVGAATIAVHRLLDSDAVRTALAGREEADFALIVPDFLYRDVIADHLPTAGFTAVEVTLPAKGFTEQAWIHLPAS